MITRNLPIRYKAFILICVVLICLSFFVGYGYGFKQGGTQVAKYVFIVAQELQQRGFIDVEIDENFIKASIFQYKNNVNGCLFIQNNTL